VFLLFGGLCFVLLVDPGRDVPKALVFTSS
jgi:hypothetical protein